MACSDDEKRRLRALDAYFQSIGRDDVFVGPGKGRSPEEMAFLLWLGGWLAVPTVECMLEGLEKEARAKPPG